MSKFIAGHMIASQADVLRGLSPVPAPRLDYQPLFGKMDQDRTQETAEIEPILPHEHLLT